MPGECPVNGMFVLFVINLFHIVGVLVLVKTLSFPIGSGMLPPCRATPYFCF
jgi:hypothetical protein